MTNLSGDERLMTKIKDTEIRVSESAFKILLHQKTSTQLDPGYLIDHVVECIGSLFLVLSIKVGCLQPTWKNCTSQI